MHIMTEFEVTFYPLGKKVILKKPTTILDAAKKIGLDLSGPCGGHGKCGKCMVKISKFPDNIYIPPDPVSKSFISEINLKKSYRLACTFRLSGNFCVELPIWIFEHDLGAGSAVKIAALVDGWINAEVDKEFKFNPVINIVECHLPKPTLDDNISDLERLIKYLNANLKESKINYKLKCKSFSNNMLKGMSHILRENDWNVNTVLAYLPNGTELLDLRQIEPDRMQTQIPQIETTINGCYGVSVDIGTSTIVGYLIDLLTGKELSVDSAVNPQVRIGADVITRIRYSTHIPNGNQHLSEMLRNCINRLIDNVSRKANIDPLQIYELVAVGNTVMLHNFLGLDLTSLGTAPYTPVTNGNNYLNASELNININPNGKVYVGPMVSGFLGADAVVTALITDLWSPNNKSEDDNRLTLALDIGTNGEILLSDNKRLLGCSAAAGPAFEGSNLRFGMRAVPGAVYKVKIRNKMIETMTLGNKLAVGITGSGVVYAINEFLKNRAIMKNGNIDTSTERSWLRLSKDKKVKYANEPTESCDLPLPELLVVPKQNSGLNTSITITQNDIREIQLAKAAIRTGIELLLSELDKNIEDITQVYLAGAFGNYLDPKSAIEIKLLPDIPISKIQQIGNSAGTGAKLLLGSRMAKIQANRIAETMECIDLATKDEFQDNFIRNMEF